MSIILGGLQPRYFGPSRSVRRLVGALGGAALVTAASVPAPASAKARPSCDRLGGKTLVANDRVRLVRDRLSTSEVDKLEGYAVGAPGLRFRACSYRTRRVSTLRVSIDFGQDAEPTSHTWAVNGDYAAVSASESGTDVPTDRSAGISRENLTMWNARTGKLIVECCGLTGVRFSELVVSAGGSVGAIGSPYRLGYADDDVGGNRPRTESVVVVYEPSGPRPPGSSEQAWRKVSSGPIGSLAGLAISRGTLVWSSPLGIQQAPLL